LSPPQITDERDPYFLYNLEINEHSFHQLKREQGILVELNVFPSKLMELLELCLLNPASKVAIAEGSFDSMNNFTSQDRPSQLVVPKLPVSNGSSFDNSVFTTKLDAASGTLSIVESNMFKQITHIVLHFTQGNDEAIKMYLNSRLQFTLDFARSQAKEILQLASTTQSQSSETHAMEQELSDLRTQREVDIKTLKSEFLQEMSAAHMASLEAQEQLRLKYEAQVEALRQELGDLQRDSQAKVVVYDHQVAGKSPWHRYFLRVLVAARTTMS
jgi:spindle assembly abnormal protein 6